MSRSGTRSSTGLSTLYSHALTSALSPPCALTTGGRAWSSRGCPSLAADCTDTPWAGDWVFSASASIFALLKASAPGFRGVLPRPRRIDPAAMSSLIGSRRKEEALVGVRRERRDRQQEDRAGLRPFEACKRARQEALSIPHVPPELGPVAAPAQRRQPTREAPGGLAARLRGIVRRRRPT